MINRILHLDAEDDEEREPKKNYGGNTRIPFGLCKRYGIDLPEGASPKDAWDALEGKGIKAQEVFRHLKETGSVKDFKPKEKAVAPKDNNKEPHNSDKSNDIVFINTARATSKDVEKKKYVNPREKQFGKYNQYSLNKIRDLVTRGQKYAAEGKTYEELLYGGKLNDLSFDAQMMMCLGLEYPKWDVPEIKTYYRIGEPSIDTYGGTYHNSYNSMENRPEKGISVATPEWLDGTFFDTTDKNITRRGVWEIKGIELPTHGGDDEPLIIPMDWARRTNIKTHSGLKQKLVSAKKGGGAT
ncbi:MAG: hypothetical protein LUD47_07650 [Clostridia bacterium]|nr:hypothetical protein [Clostridia bacterium]